MTDAPILTQKDYKEGVRCRLSLWHEWQKKDGVAADPDAMPEEKQEREMIALARQYYAQDANVEFGVTAVNPADNTSVEDVVLKKIPGTDEYDLIGTSAGTDIKPNHIQDLAFQKHVLTGAGYKIRNAEMLLIDGAYTRAGKVDLDKMLKPKDATKRMYGALKEVAGNIAKIRDVLADLKTAPSFEVGLDCANPFDCSHKTEHGIPKLSVFNVLARKDAQAVAKRTGSFKVEMIPDDMIPNTPKAIDIACAKSGKEHVDTAQLQAFLGRIEYPIYYLDYETIQSAEPFFDGTKPYRQVPFQFSLHVQDVPGGPLVHHEFIHQDRSDPRRAFTEALLNVTGKNGTVIVYNQAFEASRNSELAADFPEHAAALNALNDRMLDLYEPFKVRALYHPAQEGSASIKYVLPAFTSLSYKHLEIGNGLIAMEAYADYIRNKPGASEPQKLFQNLFAYCKLDTYAMVELLDVVKQKAFPAPSAAPAPGPSPA